MEKLFTEYGAAMSAAHKALVALNERQEEEIAVINEEYNDVLIDYESAKATSNRIINKFSALLDRQPQKVYSWENNSEVMEAHAAAMGEIERINTRFNTKWGTRYEEYERKVAASKRKYGKMYHKTMKESGFNPDALTDDMAE